MRTSPAGRERSSVTPHTLFSENLADAFHLRLLIGNEPRIAERLEVQSMPAIARRLYEVHFGKANLVTEAELRQILADVDAAAAADPHKFSANFLRTEWSTVVDAWQLDSWDVAYRDVKRLGRKTRLAESLRQWTGRGTRIVPRDSSGPASGMRVS